jgi:hypothetical protein
MAESLLRQLKSGAQSHQEVHVSLKYPGSKRSFSDIRMRPAGPSQDQNRATPKVDRTTSSCDQSNRLCVGGSFFALERLSFFAGPSVSSGIDLAMFLASESDERQEPLTLIEKALALAPEDTYVQFNAAETYESLGFRKEALDWVHNLIAAGYPLDDIEHSPVLSDLVRDSQFLAMVKSQNKNGEPTAP